jgi:penicillin-binding protein 2
MEISTIYEYISVCFIKIKNYFSDYRNPFIDRSISGLYTPGSIVKPFLAFAALEEKIISPQKEIVSTGELVVSNPYNKDKPTIFKDWKAHGATDMRRAIAVSSDVYFYQIGGGYGSQKGLGIQNIKKYLKLFGFSNKTGFDNNREEVGVIPDEEWKKENFKDGNWRVGDTYNTSIGQYGTQITPIQALVAVSALSNGGNIVTPSLMFTSTTTRAEYKKITQNLDNLDISKEGMRMAVT